MSLIEKTGPIKKATIALSSTGGDVVAAVTGKSIRVLSLAITVTTAAGTVKFQSGASTDISGVFLFAGNGQLILPHNPCGWFDTAVSEKLNAVLASAGAVGGVLTYQEVVPG